jgi:hypothetical protein
MLAAHLARLYLLLVTGVMAGWVLGRRLPPQAPTHLGQFLFWVGVPISIVAFIRSADLSGPIWIAGIVAWGAIFLGAGLAWVVMLKTTWSKPIQGSFLLTAMLGNTGYLGYPVILALVGTQFFAWAICYDLVGTVLGSYGLGVALAAHFGTARQSWQHVLGTVLKNPALWSFGLGLGYRMLPVPPVLEQGVLGFAWGMVILSLVLIGMRLSQLSGWSNLQKVAASLGIKMLLVPLSLGIGLGYLGITGDAQLVLVLQMAMPPAFATLVIAEAFDLDRNLTVTTLAVGSIGLLVMLPVWLWLFAQD